MPSYDSPTLISFVSPSISTVIDENLYVPSTPPLSHAANNTTPNTNAKTAATTASKLFAFAFIVFLLHIKYIV